MLSPSTLLASGCLAVIVIAGLTFLADSSKRAQLDRALERAKASQASVLVSVNKTVRGGSPGQLDRKRLEAMMLMVSQSADE